MRTDEPIFNPNKSYGEREEEFKKNLLPWTISDNSNVLLGPEVMLAQNLEDSSLVAVAIRDIFDKKIAQKVLQGDCAIDDIDSGLVASCLDLPDLPPLDLLIRTGGEKRISNFLLWQAAYAELYFSDALWPDFDREALTAAVDEYGSRQRRFGLTSDQVPPESPV